MMFRNFKYFLVQGFKGLVSNSLMTLASIGIVIASLVLFGFFVLFGLNLNSVGDQIKEQCEINVYMPNDMSRDNVRAIGSKLSEIEYVKEAQLYTKEERLQNYKEGVYQEQAEVIDTLEEDNPLRDAYIQREVPLIGVHLDDALTDGALGELLLFVELAAGLCARMDGRDPEEKPRAAALYGELDAALTRNSPNS